MLHRPPRVSHRPQRVVPPTLGTTDIDYEEEWWQHTTFSKLIDLSTLWLCTIYPENVWCFTAVVLNHCDLWFCSSFIAGVFTAIYVKVCCTAAMQILYPCNISKMEWIFPVLTRKIDILRNHHRIFLSNKNYFTYSKQKNEKSFPYPILIQNMKC